MRPFRIRINPEGTLMFYHVSGHTLDEAQNEAIRWINNHPKIRKARFDVILPQTEAVSV